MDRRLAAIVAADVVGYSRLIRQDEAGTLSDLRLVRQSIVDPLIDKYRGRVVKLMGDGILVEFASAVDAVSSSIDVQRAMAEWNKSRDPNQQILFRIGINLGDVVIDGDDIQGDGVNIAARLEALAEPSAICVSDAVHEQVRDRLDHVFADLGEKDVKNIDRPLQVWQWHSERTQGDTSEPASDNDAKPSVAVLPFDNMSGDPEQEYFADGIAEDIITELSRNSFFLVIARNSSFSFRGKSVDVREVGESLGVRYVLEGSVRRSGNRVRITAQLIETQTGTHVWAERYDRLLDDIFEVQDEITVNVTGAVGSEIATQQVRTAGPARLEDLKSWDRLMKANWHINRTNPEDNRIGREICESEIARGAVSSQCYSQLCLAHLFELIWSLGRRDPGVVIRDGIAAGRTAIEMDGRNGTAFGTLCMFFWVSGNHAQSARMSRIAIEIEPNSVLSHIGAGCLNAYGGPELFEKAVYHLDLAARLGPRDYNRHWTFAHKAIACIVSHRFEEAEECAETAIELDATHGSGHRFLAVAQALGGKTDLAKISMQNAQSLQKLDAGDYRESLHRMFARDEDADLFLKGLRLAGMEI
ncbi:MAG: adenylate/guanylate cyclase domain-containing protein [Arenibacterium sp.]